MSSRRRRSRLRWFAPVSIIAVCAGVAGLPNLLPAGADPVPLLPTLTPAALLNKVRTADVRAMSGDVQLSSNLGLPDLSSIGFANSGSLIDLLGGTHTGHVWMNGPDHVRVALDAPQAESDWIRNGQDVWAWDSRTEHVTHTTMKAPASGADSAPDTSAPMNPVDAAQKLLDAVDPSTAVSVRTPGYVAGRAVYELVLAPRSTASTIAAAVVAVDATTGIPLDVRIEARSSSTPAIDLRFTSISFDTPSAKTFAFTPPPGSTVTEAASASELLPIGSRRFGEGHRRRYAPTNGPPALAAPPGGDGSSVLGPASISPTVKVVGTNWDAVVIVSGLNWGGPLGGLLSNAPSVTLAAGHARLLTTTLVNVLAFDDGRLAIGALTPSALEAAIPAP